MCVTRSSSKAQMKADVCNKEPKRSTTKEDNGKVGQVDPKDVITKSNKDYTSVEVMVNSNTRVYHVLSDKLNIGYASQSVTQ